MLDPHAIVRVVESILTGKLSPTEVATLVGAQCAQAYLQGAQDTLERLGIAEAAAETSAAIAKARG